MYQSNRNGQCLICFSSLTDDHDLYSLLYHPRICAQCRRSFSRCHETFTIKGCSTTVLYDYNEFFKKLIFQYKGQYDYALKDTFLNSRTAEFATKYQDYVVVVVPSSTVDNQVRGFAPNLAIVETFATAIFSGVTKTSNYKQTRNQDREKVAKFLTIDHGERLYNHRVLIFDDVMTSSSTIQATIDLIAPYQPESIEVLVLASGQLERLRTKFPKKYARVRNFFHKHLILPIKKMDF